MCEIESEAVHLLLSALLPCPLIFAAMQQRSVVVFFDFGLRK
jgi:hypothetical protein